MKYFEAKLRPGMNHRNAVYAAMIKSFDENVGRVLARKAATPNSGRVRLLVCVSIATLLMIAGTPWPGTPNGRPLFRL